MFYVQALYTTILAALITLALAQANDIEATANAMVKLFHDCTTHTDAIVGGKARGMIITIHSNKSYLP